MTTLTATRKPRKPTTKPARHVTIGTAVNGTFAIHMTIGEGEKAKSYGYYVSRIPADFGMGFHFEKFGTEQEDGKDSEYDVNVDLNSGHHSCTCKGNTYCGHCKHVESLLALINTRRIEVLTAPKSEPKKEPAMSANDYQQTLLSMSVGSVQQINGHRVERFASAWKIDEKYAFSPRQLMECLSQREPCQRALSSVVFEDL